MMVYNNGFDVLTIYSMGSSSLPGFYLLIFNFISTFLPILILHPTFVHVVAWGTCARETLAKPYLNIKI